MALARGERSKLRTYPELVANNQLRLTTLACETGGRWSATCGHVVRELAKAKARQAPEETRARVAAGWAARWWSLLAVAGRNALAATLVDDKPHTLDGVDGETPDWPDVLHDHTPGTVLAELRLTEDTGETLPGPGGHASIN